MVDLLFATNPGCSANERVGQAKHDRHAAVGATKSDRSAKITAEPRVSIRVALRLVGAD